jgi:hypothetical protein
MAALLIAGCSHVDPIAGRAASDLPPGPLQPLPSDTGEPTPDCRTLTPARGKTISRSDADFLDIVFTNEGDETCVAHGYPTLLMRGADGRRIGEHATLRTNGAARYVDLEPGEAAVATVRFPQESGDCISGTARIEILVPGATERAFIDESHPYCPGWTVTSLARP